MPVSRMRRLMWSLCRERKVRTRFFFYTKFLNTPRRLGHPGKISGTSQIPLFESQKKGGRELFGHHPFAWKIPTPPGGLRTQKLNLCVCVCFLPPFGAKIYYEFSVSELTRWMSPNQVPCQMVCASTGLEPHLPFTGPVNPQTGKILTNWGENCRVISLPISGVGGGKAREGNVVIFLSFLDFPCRAVAWACKPCQPIPP